MEKISNTPCFYIFDHHRQLAIRLYRCWCGHHNQLAWDYAGIPEAGVGYVAHGSHVYAINLLNGSQIWRFPNEPVRNSTFDARPPLQGKAKLFSEVMTKNSILYEQIMAAKSGLMMERDQPLLCSPPDNRTDYLRSQHR